MKENMSRLSTHNKTDLTVAWSVGNYLWSKRILNNNAHVGDTSRLPARPFLPWSLFFSFEGEFVVRFFFSVVFSAFFAAVLPLSPDLLGFTLVVESFLASDGLSLALSFLEPTGLAVALVLLVVSSLRLTASTWVR